MIPSRILGISATKAPIPKPQASIIKSQPKGTAQAKGSVRRKPSFVAMAVVSIVFGPGEKVMAAQKKISAMNSLKLKIDSMFNTDQIRLDILYLAGKSDA